MTEVKKVARLIDTMTKSELETWVYDTYRMIHLFDLGDDLDIRQELENLFAEEPQGEEK